jgi:hypothetical protein
VKVCIEMHPHNVVFNPGTLERLATEIRATHVGAELDPSGRGRPQLRPGHPVSSGPAAPGYQAVRVRSKLYREAR